MVTGIVLAPHLLSLLRSGPGCGRNMVSPDLPTGALSSFKSNFERQLELQLSPKFYSHDTSKLPIFSQGKSVEKFFLPPILRIIVLARLDDDAYVRLDYYRTISSKENNNAGLSVTTGLTNVGFSGRKPAGEWVKIINHQEAEVTRFYP
ncbi:uncharacterized protein LOC112494665 isoform X2 [Cephus cinctus]|uniref:Uncharacterized protein LOC112494665 isoform X2 n=1 Tax=Cephus cinctus TaxID=211228 RepID=A0AAJ7RM92_CEPCN|nr:uncharacterized protein LOC112494665 isoform X2 [Cephus cinctus]